MHNHLSHMPNMFEKKHSRYIVKAKRLIERRNEEEEEEEDDDDDDDWQSS